MAVVGENKQKEVANPQPNIEKLIEKVEKSIELYPFDEPPDFDHFETIPDSTVANVTANPPQINDNSTETKKQSQKNENEGTLAQENDGSDNLDTNKHLKNSSESSLETKASVDLSNIEISDVESMNMLNICKNSSIEPSPNAPIPKSKPIIEVLSESNSITKSDFETVAEVVSIDMNSEKIVKIEDAIDTLNEFDATKLPIDNTPVEQITTTTESCDNERLSLTVTNNKIVELNRTIYSTTKSSAITFFCENLDDLKGIDSDSDQCLEEIKAWPAMS